MTPDFTQIPWDEIKSGLLVLRAPPSGPNTASYMEAVDKFVYELRDRVGDTVKVLVMSHDTEVFNVPEETMNQMGWFRRKV